MKLDDNGKLRFIESKNIPQKILQKLLINPITERKK